MDIETAQTRIQEIEKEMADLRRERNALSLVADPAIVRDEVRARIPEAASVVARFAAEVDGDDWYPYLDAFQVSDQTGEALFIDDNDVTGIETTFFARDNDALVSALHRLRDSLGCWRLRVDLNTLHAEWA